MFKATELKHCSNIGASVAQSLNALAQRNVIETSHQSGHCKLKPSQLARWEGLRVSPKTLPGFLSAYNAGGLCISGIFWSMG